MSDYLPFIVIGITTGSVYGIAALGLVLTYKTSGVFNFGHGAIAAAAAVVFFELHFERGIPWPIAAFVSIGVFGVVAGVIMERLAAGLSQAAIAYRIVATVGLILVVPAAFNLIYGPLAKLFPSFLPNSVAFTISGVRVGWDNVLTTLLGAGSALVLFIFFQRSRLGIAMRAVVDRPELVDLTGDSPARIRRIAWIIGCSFAAVSGVLLAQTQQQLDVVLLSLLVVQAFGAAAVGAFRNLPLAYVGGVALGVLQGVASKLSADVPALQGLDINMPFLFLFVGLLAIPKGKLVELGVKAQERVRSTPLVPARYRLPVYGLLAAAALAVPFVVGTKLPSWNQALANVLLFLSLGLLVRTSGQVSLCQIGFAAVGATTFAHTLGAGIPWVVAIALGGLVAIPVGAVVAIPAIRLSGLFLALATLGFGILLAQFFYPKSYMFGIGALETARPGMFGLDSDKGYYFVLLGFGIAGMFLVRQIERSRLGRLLRGNADSPTALSMLGTNTNVTKVIVFCISAFMAGVSGGLIAGLFGSINRESFVFVQSLVILAVLIISGTRTLPAAVIGALLLTLPPAYIEGDNVLDVSQLLFGAVAIAVGLLSGGRLSSILSRIAARDAERVVGPAGSRTAVPALAREVRP